MSFNQSLLSGKRILITGAANALDHRHARAMVMAANEGRDFFMFIVLVVWAGK